MLSSQLARGRAGSSAPARAPALIAAQAGRRGAWRQAVGGPCGAATLVRGALALGGGARGELQRVALGDGRARGGALGGGLLLQPRGALGGRQRLRQPHLGCHVYPVTYPIQPHLGCGARGSRAALALAGARPRGRLACAMAMTGAYGSAGRRHRQQNARVAPLREPGGQGGRSARGGRRRARPRRRGTGGGGVAGAAGARLQAVREPLLRVERGGGGGGVPLRGRRRRLRRRRRCRAAAALGGLVPACGALRGPGLCRPATHAWQWGRRAHACLQMKGS